MQIRALGLPEALRHADDISVIYQRAFDCSDEHRTHFRYARLASLPLYDGAVMLGVFHDATLRGFVYGFDYQPIHGWPTLVGPALREAGLDEWTRDAFELNELVVVPEYQGKGYGTALMSILFEKLNHQNILLSTADNTANRAQALYERLGFVNLISGFQYPDVNGSANIMGRRRPLR